MNCQRVSGKDFLCFENKGSSVGTRVIQFLCKEGYFLIIQELSLSHSCVEGFHKIILIKLLSLDIIKITLATSSILGDHQTVGFWHRFATRQGGNIPDHRRCLTLSQTEMSNFGARYFNKVPLTKRPRRRKVHKYTKIIPH